MFRSCAFSYVISIFMHMYVCMPLYKFRSLFSSNQSPFIAWIIFGHKVMTSLPIVAQQQKQQQQLQTQKIIHQLCSTYVRICMYMPKTIAYRLHLWLLLNTYFLFLIATNNNSKSSSSTHTIRELSESKISITKISCRLCGHVCTHLFIYVYTYIYACLIPCEMSH